MATRTILVKGDETLLKKSKPVTVFDKRLHTLLDDMLETMRQANGAGLAAPQVGVLRRVVVVETGEDGPIELVNPRIISAEGEQVGPEGCLSVPGVWGEVARPMKVTVEAQDRDGKPIKLTGEALTARAYAHEIDHLNGVLFTEKAIRYLDPDKDFGHDDEPKDV